MKAKVILEDGREVAIEINESDLAKLEKPKSFKRWRAKHNKPYHFFSSAGYIEMSFEDYDNIDIFRYNSGNYFQTKEEAEAHKNRLLKIQTIKNRIAELNQGWKPDWSNYNELKYSYELQHTAVNISSCQTLRVTHDDFYLKSKQLAQQIQFEFGGHLKLLFE